MQNAAAVSLPEWRLMRPQAQTRPPLLVSFAARSDKLGHDLAQPVQLLSRQPRQARRNLLQHFVPIIRLFSHS
jgi:hypothetical protein